MRDFVDETGPSESELIRSIRGGDSASFESSYRLHAPKVWRVARRLTGSPSAADELTQQTFLTMWAKRRSLDPTFTSLAPWLLVTVRNLSLKHLRKVEREGRAVGVAAASLIEHHHDDHGILDELGQLSPRDRELVELCFLRGYTYKEAAEQLDITPASVRNRLSRVRRNLRANVGE